MEERSEELRTLTKESREKNEGENVNKKRDENAFRTSLSLNNEQLLTIVSYCQYLIGSCFGLQTCRKDDNNNNNNYCCWK